MEQREGCEEFTFYDGPPFATGLPHFGHFCSKHNKRHNSKISNNER